MRRTASPRVVVRIALGVLLGVAGTAGALAAACTTFNGLSVSPEGGAPAACTQDAGGYVSLQEAAKACQLIADCDIGGTGQLESDIELGLGIVTSKYIYSYCVNALAGPFPPDRLGIEIQRQSLLCIARATTCAAARACLPYETLADNDPRCAAGAARGRTAFCSDNDVVDCSDPRYRYVEHCRAPAAAGAPCIEDPADPAIAGCGATQVKCASRITQCDVSSGLLWECQPNSTVNVVKDCSSIGGACGATLLPEAGAPEAGCLTGTNGTEYRGCDPSVFRNECRGDSIATCTFGEVVSLSNCAAIGKRCSPRDQPHCFQDADTCDPSSPGIGECEGSAITLCVDGKRITFDCGCVNMTCGAGDSGAKLHCVPK